jgi:D-glycero-beta-D-manno-heptose 1-phosphate adenylyltransferase
MHRLEFLHGKILSEQKLDQWMAVSRLKMRKIVFTNGCFDVLHRGHIEYLAQAADLGNALVVGLNTDESVKKLKGPSRPYLDEEARALILASLSFVSVVVLFNDETPYELIKRVQPDFLVKGGDYRIEDIVGYDIVMAKGGKVLTIDLVKGYSSTGTLDKISPES